MITLEQFQDGFGDDTLAGSVFDALPAPETPSSIIVKAINAYKVAQDAYNVANPTNQSRLVGDKTLGSIEVLDGTVNRIQNVVISYKENYDFDTFLPGNM